MTPEETAEATAAAVSGLSSGFMLEPRTYGVGGELGFEGLSFYICGRAGVLGDVDADIVTAAMVFFAPAMVRQSWEAGRQVLAPLEAAQRFADVGYDWARARLQDDAACARLAELAGAVATSASVAGAPIFAGWRLLPVPEDPRAAALHQMNALRELRMALHAGAVLATGLRPVEAVAHRSPFMLPFFGWTEPYPDAEVAVERWTRAEAATNVALGPAYSVLDEAERAELVELCATVRPS